MSGLRPSRLLWPLVPLYAAAIGLKGVAYEHRWLRQHHLGAPVLSVGNLSVGGAGKTPFVLCLVQLLTAHGYTVDVLSRGYGRNTQVTERVVPASNDAARYGDEPLLLAEAGGAPVYVGRSRYAAGLLVEAERAGVTVAHVLTPPDTQPHLHLLDDGFQHRQLARSLDIVLLHPSDVEQSLLPAGRLREPLSALRRAHIAVLRAGDTRTEEVLRQRGLTLPIWRINRQLAVPADLQQLSTPALPWPEAPCALAFCGIAHPQEFFAALVEAGIHLVATRAFPDHHTYTANDLASLVTSARATHATHLLTTEKDWVRLPSLARTRLQEAAPIVAIPLRTRLLNEEQALDQLLTLAHLSRESY